MSKQSNKRQLLHAVGIPDVFDPAKPNFKLFSSPFYLIAHADFMFHEELDRVLIKRGILRSTYRILTVLKEAGSISIKDLSEHALLKYSTVSRAIVRMRRKGWVTTSSKVADNRVTEVHLTKKGMSEAESAMQLGSRQLHSAAAELREEELTDFVSTLQKIIRNLSKLPLER